MRAFNRTTIALCLSLAILFLTVGSAAPGDMQWTEQPNEPVGPVYDASGVTEASGIIEITMDTSQLDVHDIEDEVNESI